MSRPIQQQRSSVEAKNREAAAAEAKRKEAVMKEAEADTKVEERAVAEGLCIEARKRILKRYSGSNTDCTTQPGQSHTYLLCSKLACKTPSPSLTP